ncbi:MAG: hypothetical protein EB163_08935, partial [Nitrososphaeria archaeon]|nr:hypothetical protein [Nitrososphaeria archaeon]
EKPLRFVMTEEKQKQEMTKVIFVNKVQIRVEQDTLLGKEILQLAGFNPQEYDLYLNEGGSQGKKIGPDESVRIKNGLRFNAIRREVPYG